MRQGNPDTHRTMAVGAHTFRPHSSLDYRPSTPETIQALPTGWLAQASSPLQMNPYIILDVVQ